VWIGDYRSEDRLSERQGYELALDWFYYDPYPVSVPFAAYLIPKDLAPGTRVWVEDLIENLVGECWNQGDVYRLEKAEAVWTGKDLVIDHDPKKPPQMLIEKNECRVSIYRRARRGTVNRHREGLSFTLRAALYSSVPAVAKWFHAFTTEHAGQHREAPGEKGNT